MTTRARIGLLFCLALPLLNSCQFYDQMVVDLYFPADDVFRQGGQEEKVVSEAAETPAGQVQQRSPRSSYNHPHTATPVAMTNAVGIISEGSTPSPQLPSDMRHPTTPQLPSDMRHPTTPGINTPEEEASSTESAPATMPNDAELRGLRSPNLDNKLPATIKQ